MKLVNSLRWLSIAFFILLFNTFAALFLRLVSQNPDGLGYFSYVWSIFSEGTLSFATIYESRNIAIPFAKTSSGWLANHWSFGTAMLWAPFFELRGLCHYYVGGVASTIPTAICLVNFGTMVLGVSSLILAYSALTLMQESENRFITVLLILFGTPLFNYTFIDTTYAHAATAFTSGLFLWYWLATPRQDDPCSQDKATENTRTREKASASLSILRWTTLGILAGIATCVRTQEILIIVAPIWEWTRLYRQETKHHLDLWKCAAAMVGGFLFGFSPQALIWNMLYGSSLAAPSSFNLAWGNFAILPTLFSSYHGLATWTPLYVFALAGLAWEGIAGNTKSWVLLSIIAGQLLINSFSIAWWGGLSFGVRQLTGTTLIAGLGVAFFLRHIIRLSMPLRWTAITVIILCSAWTFLLALRHYVGTLDLLLYTSPRDLVAVALSPQLIIPTFRTVYENSSFVFFDLYGIFIAVELTVFFWFWRLHRTSTNSWLTSTRWLLPPLLVLVLFVDIKIFQAHYANRPHFTSGTYIDAKQLGDFFKSEAYAIKAIYYAKRGDQRTAAANFSLAETALPISPATEPWRQLFHKWRYEYLEPANDVSPT